jgi:hypothetical protein
MASRVVPAWGHDRDVVAGELVHQARFAYVGWPDQRRRNSRKRLLARACRNRIQALAQAGKLADGVGPLHELGVLVGKIQRRFGEHRIRQPIDQRADLGRKRPTQLRAAARAVAIAA